MPNVVIAFANREPNREKLSEDTWIILKISQDLRWLTDIADGVNRKKKMVKESYE